MIRPVFSFLLAILATSALAQPLHLRCEYRANPLGIDQRTPHLSWQSDNKERNWRQSAYQILVAQTPQLLRPGAADIWDSQKVATDESVGILYSGPKLESRRRYYWTVRVWDAAGKPSAWAQPCWWEMGLLEPTDWHAQWITGINPDETADRAGIRWIWTQEQNARKATPLSVVTFRKTVDLPAKPTDAALFVLAYGDWQATVNGVFVGGKTEWHAVDRNDITGLLVAGRNTIEIKVQVQPLPQVKTLGRPPSGTKSAGLAALVKILSAEGKWVRLPTDETWLALPSQSRVWKNAEPILSLDAKDKTYHSPGPLPQSASAFRRTFRIMEKVERARLYFTAMGVYSAFVNGQRTGPEQLAPGWTDYHNRVAYQTYDVTSLLQPGENVLAALMGDGWFGSPLTSTGDPFLFGNPPRRLMGQLEIRYASGKTEVIPTDQTWRTRRSGIRDSGIYKGEEYDARFEPQGWKGQAFSDARWPGALVAEKPSIQPSAQMDADIETIATIRPLSVSSPAAGVFVFDMGQNLTGKAAIKALGEAGTRIKLRFAETLRPDGTLDRRNLRNADATDVFVLRGEERAEEWEPEFSFQGFRYVEVTGYPGKPTLNDLRVDGIGSLNGAPSGTISTSNPTLNKYWQMSVWGQRSNFISVPMDCPQRDERLGWTGDAAAFWRTGSYNFDLDAFSHKWMQDLRETQDSEGAFANIAPKVIPAFGAGAPGWGDAGVIIPWTAWMQYGDRGIIWENWTAMEHWMGYIQRTNPLLLRKTVTGADFGDWLAPDPKTPSELVATAYWALIARMMSQMANAIGKKDACEKYAALYERINRAYQKAYVRADGTVGSGTQTGYVLTLYGGLFTQSQESSIVNHLVAAIEKNGGHLSTGFLGTPYLLFALSEHGRPDVAYQLLLNRSYPSWGYMVDKGASTWWERWNSDTSDPKMNSYNHYAFGSVVAWLYRAVGGIDTSADSPGFHEIVIHPYFDKRLTQARTEYDSVYGKIVTEWKRGPRGAIALKVTIPANTHARVLLPQSRHDVGSGTYRFQVPKG